MASERIDEKNRLFRLFYGKGELCLYKPHGFGKPVRFIYEDLETSVKMSDEPKNQISKIKIQKGL
jgi:hypothetical protein